MNTIEITKTLYDIFNALNEHYWGNTLPEPFITIVQGVTKRKSFMGAYAGQSYAKVNEEADDELQDLRHEIMIAGEFLKDGIYELCDTMQHELCHFYSRINNIKDMDKMGKKHTKKFKKIAEEHGLYIDDYDEKNGWNQTQPTEEFKEFVDTLNIDPAVLDYFRNTILPPSKPTPKKRFICPQCGQQVQAKKTSHVACADCDMVMDYWDMTDAENPVLLTDHNDGYVLNTPDNWYNIYMCSLQEAKEAYDEEDDE